MPLGWGSLKNPTMSPLLQGSVVPGYPILLPSKWFSGGTRISGHHTDMHNIFWGAWLVLSNLFWHSKEPWKNTEVVCIGEMRDSKR